MTAPPAGLTLQDLLLAEAVKDLEADTPLRDDAALAQALAAGGGREAMLVARARRLAAETGLDRDAAHLRDRLVLIGLALAALAVVLATAVSFSLLGEGRHINAVAAIVLLIVPNALGIGAWGVLTVMGSRDPGGAFGRAVAAVAAHRRAPAHVRRVWPAAARELDALRLTPWALGGLNHLLWALVYAAATLIVAAVLALSQYRLGWETTILAPQTLHDAAQAIAWLPERLGLPAAVPAQLDDPEASRLLGRWLIAATLVYGTLPRALLALLCGTVLRVRPRRAVLDLADPYYRRVVARLDALSPTRVLDVEQAATAPPHASEAAPAADGPFVVLGFELPAELPLPPALLERAAWSERVDGGLDEREALLHRLAARPPAQLLVVGHAPSTPDRGTLRFLEAARAGRTALLLAPTADASSLARWREWLAASGRDDIAVFADAAQAQAWS